MCLGCDIYCEGFKNIGPSNLHDLLLKSKEKKTKMNEALIELLNTKLRTTSDIVQIYIDAIMYEPYNEISIIQYSSVKRNEYLNNKNPASINQYLKACVSPFDKKCKISRKKDVVLQCKGHGYGSMHDNFFIEKVTCST